MPWYVIFVGGIATLGTYTLLYRENSISRFFEHVFVGVGAGYGFYFYITSIIVPNWGKPLFVEGKWYWIFPLLIGGMYYLIYSRRLVWMARMVMLTTMGLYAGLAFKQFITVYVPQIAASFKPVVARSFPYVQFSNLLFFVTIVTVMSYFFFSFEHRHPLIRGSSRIGRWMLMVSFGAIFGSTVMGRMSLFIDRAAFLLFDFLRLSPR
jgi:hypothetical protein